MKTTDTRKNKTKTKKRNLTMKRNIKYDKKIIQM